MNRDQMRSVGIPEDLLDIAIEALKKNPAVRLDFHKILANPKQYLNHPNLGLMASLLIEEPREKVTYKVWGREHIESGAFEQINLACEIPAARSAALMADAHQGYGLPIGGVLALENAVSPYAVGVDIGCRMRISMFDLPVSYLRERRENLVEAILANTRFGTGSEFQKPKQHDVLDNPLWSKLKVLKQNRDKAVAQIGTSGGGNHFVEFGIVTIGDEEYLGLLSHSGSRGTGAQVCNYYSKIAVNNLKPSEKSKFAKLAWLSLSTEAGQEYWAAMNLMGEYAHANHELIHQDIAKHLGAEIVDKIENHHNFAWKEDGLIVHRKGATPAHLGVKGVIPGSMGEPTFLVEGLGVADSINSASHGAGRLMSRTKAKELFSLTKVREELAAKDITILGAGADEVPGAYKRIEDIMDAQKDLVKIVGKFDPKIVKMAGCKADDGD